MLKKNKHCLYHTLSFAEKNCPSLIGISPFGIFVQNQMNLCHREIFDVTLSSRGKLPLTSSKPSIFSIEQDQNHQIIEHTHSTLPIFLRIDSSLRAPCTADCRWDIDVSFLDQFLKWYATVFFGKFKSYHFLTFQFFDAWFC